LEWILLHLESLKSFSNLFGDGQSKKLIAKKKKKILNLKGTPKLINMDHTHITSKVDTALNITLNQQKLHTKFPTIWT
jgi:hypothetical protein